uniref:THUMP domain-containing protein n=1 Tax=Kalanchoe fedtschenkoi TaxID=63787 RepID=A0A7N1A269_KALFE
MMRPWEQHSNVIIIPRFDYNAPSSLLRHSHTGFLITCPIKREKSATKEAMSILEKFFGSLNTTNAAGSLDVCFRTQEMVGEYTTTEMSSINSEDAADELLKSYPSNQKVSQENGNTVRLSLVKLTRSGLLLFIFPSDISMDTTDIVSNIMESLGNGSLKTPRWCHRIFPIQATCNLNEKELRAVVLKLVHEFVKDEKQKLVRPIKYAVGFNRRGVGEKELKASKHSNDSSIGALLDRNKCFEIAGSAVKDVIPDSVVDLNNPELSIIVELLPLSGVTNGSPVVAVSVLPSIFVVTKPKLCIKALLSASKMTDTAL